MIYFFFFILSLTHFWSMFHNGFKFSNHSSSSGFWFSKYKQVCIKYRVFISVNAHLYQLGFHAILSWNLCVKAFINAFLKVLKYSLIFNLTDWILIKFWPTFSTRSSASSTDQFAQSPQVCIHFEYSDFFPRYAINIYAISQLAAVQLATQLAQGKK